MNPTPDFDQTKNFYCSQKFWWLSVDIEKLRTLSCCAATPIKINFDHISQHPGDLFNSPEILTERQQMLDNQPLASCSTACWIPESKSQISRRISMKSHWPTHISISSTPETLHIITGSDCNMTCIYCCKQYSSAWSRDIANSGPYSVVTDDDRFTFNTVDQVLLNLSQKDLENSRVRNIVIDEICRVAESSTLKEIIITGGEPFLYLGLEQLVQKLSACAIPIKIYSGLGVNTGRLYKEISKLSKLSKIQIIVSAESTGHLYQLLRNGNTWNQFENNIDVIKQHNIEYSFSATVSNLALLGIDEFIDYAGETKILWNPCTDPDFFSVNIIDDNTKSKLLSQVLGYPKQLQDIINTVSCSFSLAHKNRLKVYIEEFTQRRKINLECLPNHFVDWLQQT